MIIEFCDCTHCRSMFKHSLVRRSLENEFPVILADDHYCKESKHFVGARWCDIDDEIAIIRLAVKSDYDNIDRWSDN